MTELVDELVDMIGMNLANKRVELSVEELDEIRSLLDDILEKYEGDN